MMVTRNPAEVSDSGRSAQESLETDQVRAPSPHTPESGWNSVAPADSLKLPAIASRSSAALAEVVPRKKLRRIVCLLARERTKQVAAMISLLSQERGVEVQVECVTDLGSLNRKRRGHSDTLMLIDATLFSRASHRVEQFTRTQPGAVRTMILLDDWPDITILTRFVLHGVSGCILLSSPASFYRRAISAISCGELWFPRQTMSDAIGRLLETMGSATALEGDTADDSQSLSSVHRLTEREQAIVALLRAGLTNKEIGRKLGISNETVKKHLGRVFRRLGVRNRTQLALETEVPSAR